MHPEQIKILFDDSVRLLEKLISAPSLSGDEEETAATISSFLQEKNVPVNRCGNNIWSVNRNHDPVKPTLLLNSHHDTVSANSGYTRNPFLPVVENGRLYGLGSTDAGASLVCLLAAFLFFYERADMPFNIVFAASAEEEISGKNGIEKLFSDPDFAVLFKNKNSFAVVGEPTQLQLAVAEKGLMVVDCIVNGRAGHAAREEGDNALYKAMEDITRLRNLSFEKSSAVSGDIKMTVTSIETENKTHNIIPASCRFTIDIRSTEMYSHEDILELLRKNLQADIRPRSTRLRATAIDTGHPVVVAGVALGKKIYGSPTMSDKALIPFPALKCGPGNSAQSHSADEYVEIKDIEEGISFYISLLENTMNSFKPGMIHTG